MKMENKIRAILVDDEKQSRVVMTSLLDSFSKEIDIVGEASNVEEAYELIIKEKPALVFLDIQMPRANGFSLLKKFNEIPFEVIFVTSYDQYAINAIKFSALDYLLKPVEVSDLKDAVSKAVKSISKKENTGSQVVNLLHNLNPETKDRKIAVHAGESVKLINSSNILYIESDEGCCNLMTLNNEKYSTAKYLKDFEDYFGETSDFIRIHKSCLINVNHIKGYNKGEPFIIEMVNGQTFEVARRKKPEVLEKLKK